ncbi:MAG TPA: DUF5117 domain-containing protein, partial [Burkholderiaceae bacterium]|nr:DUF5117 domain-containing protein [Burkholderiaceae bacterium]
MNKQKPNQATAPRPLSLCLAAAMALASTGCAMMPTSHATAATQTDQTNSKTAAAPAAPGSPPKAATSPLKPFDAVIAQAQRSDGFIPLWREQDKVWLELGPDVLGKPLFLSTTLSSGLGQSHFLPGLSGQEYVVELQKEGERIQLIAKNLRVRAPAGSPLARALTDSYSDSLLAVAPVASAAHPQRQSLLVEAAHLFGADIPGALTALEATYRLPYNLDRVNSYIERTHTDSLGTSITFKAHYLLPKLPVIRPATHGAPTPNPQTEPRPPKVVPDARSLFLGHTYSLMPLPSQPMHPRKADERVGHFTT